MKIKLEFDDELAANEVIIKANQDSAQLQKLYALVQAEVTKQAQQAQIEFRKENRRYVVDVKDVLFFETSDNKVFAHTQNDFYQVNAKLYQLEAWLGDDFLRISKSGIVNVPQIMAFSKSVLGNRIEFFDSQKELYASRRYAKKLNDRLNGGN